MADILHAMPSKKKKGKYLKIKTGQICHVRSSRHHDECLIITLCMTPYQTVAVGSLCDNIEVDPETGDLWLGCHPNGLKVFMFDPKDPPGSEVCRFTFSRQ